MITFIHFAQSTEMKDIYLSTLQRHQIYFSNDSFLQSQVKVNGENRHLRTLKIISCEECMCHLQIKVGSPNSLVLLPRNISFRSRKMDHNSQCHPNNFIKAIFHMSNASNSYSKSSTLFKVLFQKLQFQTKIHTDIYQLSKFF